LELAALIANIGPEDEVIMPSFTYPSTASAFALRGATPVFVDIRPDTLNIDETLIEAAITPRTRAIVPVHYGGVFCNMDVICDIAHRHGLFVIEDAAHAIGSVPTTQRGHMSIYSFHDTKNIVCGEGGALLIHDESLVDRADILWFCGTDRRAFLDGRVDHYTWQDIGSSFPPSELQAAVLWSQLSGDTASNLTQQRQHIWDLYHAAFLHHDIYHRPTTGHNAHVYYLLVSQRETVLRLLNQWGIGAAFHYVPLHSSPAGRMYGRVHGSMGWTNDISRQIIRLPLFVGKNGMNDGWVEDVIQKCKAVGL
jgi:dTDP-4-amino-4,6-dideoxygalactose transaminase